MNKLLLEIENWGRWELEKDFSSLEIAKMYGEERFPQNEWRIFDRIAGVVVHTHDPALVIQSEAAQEVERFRETDRWRNFFSEQGVSIARNSGRLVEIASRQRQDQQRRSELRRINDQRRAERLRGFNFVGNIPIVFNRNADDLFGETKKDKMGEKTNWKSEGF